MEKEKDTSRTVVKPKKFFNRGISTLEIPTELGPNGERLKFMEFPPNTEIDVPLSDDMRGFFMKIGSLKEE